MDKSYQCSTEWTKTKQNMVNMYCMAPFIQSSKFGKSVLLEDSVLANFGVNSDRNGDPGELME